MIGILCDLRVLDVAFQNFHGYHGVFIQFDRGCLRIVVSLDWLIGALRGSQHEVVRIIFKSQLNLIVYSTPWRRSS